ncbi:hypothetical protein [Altibacter sp.]|uniref:hypothetical protein n=1 Tax=Altibacter sp. TaxID=2024823 RepID=UPI0025C15E30|nr:hypothetical protein [Altibacter sp.]
MKKQRKKLIHWLFKKTQLLYCRFKKKAPWNITTLQLLQLPTTTFGHHLGSFLFKNGFELLPKVERHDAYHVLTGYSTRVEDEIALQFLCFGNGKRTPYLLGVLIVGSLLLPEYAGYYRDSFRIGKQLNPFHHYDYKLLLKQSFTDFKNSIFSEEQRQKLELLQKRHTYIHLSNTH